LNLIAEKDYAMSIKSSIPIEKMRVGHHFHKDSQKILLISYPGRSFLAKGKQGRRKLQLQNDDKTKFYKWLLIFVGNPCCLGNRNGTVLLPAIM
jgi:hypothetical protein